MVGISASFQIRQSPASTSISISDLKCRNPLTVHGNIEITAVYDKKVLPTGTLIHMLTALEIAPASFPTGGERVFSPGLGLGEVCQV